MDTWLPTRSETRRWKPVILWWLLSNKVPLRFTILRTKMPRISQKVLTQQLRELEQDGLIKRQMFAEMPVRVEYSLTPFGRKLRPILQAPDSWARRHIPQRRDATPFSNVISSTAKNSCHLVALLAGE